jgi:hypothetical protein
MMGFFFFFGYFSSRLLKKKNQLYHVFTLYNVFNLIEGNCMYDMQNDQLG